MWIRDVDVPEALVDAHSRGELVIFVGAGASLGAPSSLPGFRRLTEGVAADANAPVAAEQLSRPDVLLGELDDNPHFDVHRRVAARIGVSTSRPSPLHLAIAELATASPTIRIVTTNYDRHLSSVLADKDVPVAEYAAPALPMGDDFTGLVYLHGSLEQEPSALVVTDADFGRAYLRDAWATRFLERMFTTYTVLFVGYSHDDVVMSYLARGLGRASSRFVLTSKPEGTNWRRLRIRPVGYPAADGSHDAVVDAIAGWASWAAMGLLDHRQRVADLVSTAPSQVPEDASYLEAVVANGETVGFFTEHARGEDWLTWAVGQPEFRRLFDPSATATACTQPLAYWFAQHFVMDEHLSGRALSVVQNSGGRLAAATWLAIGHQLHIQSSPRAEWLGSWLVLLVQNAPEASGHWLDYALVKCRWPEDRAAVLLLFDHLAEPQPVSRPSFGPDGAATLYVRLRGDTYWLRKAWDDVFVPNQAEAAPDILAIVDRHLRRAHRLLSTAGAARPGWDPVTFRRSGIEQHPQDSTGEPLDVLIDAARTCLEAQLDSDADVGSAYLKTWEGTDVPLLRRLAVHGWVHRSDIDATTKIAWLRDRGWLFDDQLRHEVFRLIETALADADLDVANALAADAVAGEDDTEHCDYRSFNALTWMTRHAPDLQSARDALDQLRAAHPDFDEREYPDLGSSWSWSESVGSQPHRTAESLHQLIETDPGAAITDLRRYQDATSPFDSPNWNGALAVLAEAVRTWPADGSTVLDADGSDQPGIAQAVVRGWAGATLDDESAQSIIVRLLNLDLSAVADDVAEMLAARGPSEAEPTDWHRVPAARDLAAAAWTALEGTALDTQRDDWLGVAINHPAGKLTQFWVQTIAAEWRDVGDNWSGLPAATRDQLDSLLGGDDERTAMAEIVLASQLHFFFAADRDWCERQVLPLLDWTNPARARRTWDGYLYWGRWNDQLLEAGLLSQYLQTALQIETFPDELRDRLSEHLAAVALHSELDVDIPNWLTTFTSTVDIHMRTRWMDHVSWLLSDLPTDAVEHQWRRWMRRYWQDRVASVPAQLTIEEASAMGPWVLYLTDSVSNGVALATTQPARLAEHSSLLHNLTDERITRAPTAFGQLVTHLLQGTQPPFYDCHSLTNVVQALRAQPTPVDTRAIIEQAVRLGCSDAPTW